MPSSGLVLSFLSSRVLGQYDPLSPAGSGAVRSRCPRSAATGGAEHHQGRARAVRRPGRLPDVGLSAREHASAAVHRRALAARALPDSGRRVRRRRRHRCRRVVGPAGRRGHRSACRVGSAIVDRDHPDAGAAGRFRPADGVDDAAGGACGPCDGCGRADRHPVGRRRSGSRSPFAGSVAAGRSTESCGRCWAWT